MKQLLITIAALVLVGCGPSVPDIDINSAAVTGDIETVKQHLAAGADVNGWPDEGGQAPPLYWAAHEGHKEIVELLIANGADVNAKDRRGETSLHAAALSPRKEIAELLIAEGADVNAKDQKGKTPLDTAYGQTAELLRKHGGKTKKELEAAGN